LEEVLIIKEVIINRLVSNSNAMNEDCNHSRVDLIKIRLYKKNMKQAKEEKCSTRKQSSNLENGHSGILAHLAQILQRRLKRCNLPGMFYNTQYGFR
jgi:hypothetical protein